MSSLHGDWMSASIDKRVATNIKYWEKQGKKLPQGTKSLPFITISREYGALARYIVKIIIDRLNEDQKTEPFWGCYNNEILNEMQMNKDFLNYLDRERTNIKTFLESMFRSMPERTEVFRKLSETLVTIASKGHCVLVGRGSAILTNSIPNGFHVRLIDSMENRIKKIMSIKDFKGKTEAEKFVTDNDKQRESFVKEYTGKSVHDEKNYDLVVNMTNLSDQQVADIILSSFKIRFRN